MTKNYVSWITSAGARGPFDILKALDDHVREVSSTGWELAATETIEHGTDSGFVLFWKKSQ